MIIMATLRDALVTVDSLTIVVAVVFPVQRMIVGKSRRGAPGRLRRI